MRRSLFKQMKMGHSVFLQIELFWMQFKRLGLRYGKDCCEEVSSAHSLNRVIHFVALGLNAVDCVATGLLCDAV